MTIEEYNKRIKEIGEVYRREKAKLDREFALSHSSIKVGDILQDHYHIIKVETISVSSIMSHVKCCLYEGTELNKDGSIKKRQSDRVMHQINVNRVNGQRYSYLKDHGNEQ